MQKIEYLEIEKLQPHPKNPRFTKDEQFKKLCESIKKNPDYFETRPILCNKDFVIFAGNMRWRAGKEIGLKEVPVSIMDIPEERQREIMIRDNHQNGEWDFDILANNFDLKELIDWGFDEKALGLEFDKLIETEEDEVPEVDDTKEPDSKLGEVYQLGRHRLMCGDATKIEDVEKLMDGKKAGMVFTDPPYGVNVGEKLGGRHILNDENVDAMTEIVKPAFVNIAGNIKNGACYYICSPQGGDQELMMMMMMRDAGIKCRHQIIWKKDVAVFSMGRLDYDYIHEPILYGWKESHQFYGEKKKSVWEFARPKSSKLHPTMKPVELISEAIKNSSKSEDIVLDLFGGSGSTLIASEQTGRTCFMMELDPKYCDVIRKRYENYVNGKSIK